MTPRQTTADVMRGVLAEAMRTRLGRGLVLAIALMTAAIIALAGVVVGALLSSGGAPEARLNLTAAPELAIVLPDGFTLVSTEVAGGALVVRAREPDGGEAVFVSPVPDGARPFRLPTQPE